MTVWRTADDLLRLQWRLWRGCLGGLFASRTPFAPQRLLVMAGFIPVFLALQALHWFALLLDEIVFPGFRRVEVRRPLFVVGIPRSGTTMLHRVLARDPQFSTFALWELLFAPSVLERKFWRGVVRTDRFLGSPLRRLADWLQRAVFRRLDAIHEVSLGDPEEDYFTLLPVFGCFLLVLAFPNSETVWRLSRFDTEMDGAERRRILAFYRSCLQRHLYVHGTDKVLLSKNPSFTPMVSSLCEAFPDCRVIGLVRSPLSTVPSLLSSLQDGLRLFNGRRQWDDFRPRMVRALVHYYRHLPDRLSALAEDRYAIVEMRQLCGDLHAAVGSIYDRLGLAMTAEFDEYLDEAGRQARSYQSAHKYELEDFGLDAQALRKEFADAFDTFDFQPVAAKRQSSAEPAGSV